MRITYRQLAERIQGEIPTLAQLVQRVLTGWSKVCQMPADDLYLDSVALNLHSFYSGIERIFELVAQRIDQQSPKSQTWHRDLVWRMAEDVPTVRPAVISERNALALDEFRRFRHLVRHTYTMQLVPEKIQPLISNLETLWPALRAELLAFAAFLDVLAQGHDQ
ncbi:MAG: antitoxin [Oscillochloridaceae bacterium umkhey_bin13]